MLIEYSKTITPALTAKISVGREVHTVEVTRAIHRDASECYWFEGSICSSPGIWNEVRFADGSCRVVPAFTITTDGKTPKVDVHPTKNESHQL
jgi:hypothetical protein